MKPANKGFSADVGAIVQDLRLIIKRKLVFDYRQAQVPFQRHAVFNLHLHLYIEKTQGIAACRLGLIQGDIRLLEQRVRGLFLAVK